MYDPPDQYNNNIYLSSLYMYIVYLSIQSIDPQSMYIHPVYPFIMYIYLSNQAVYSVCLSMQSIYVHSLFFHPSYLHSLLIYPFSLLFYQSVCPFSLSVYADCLSIQSVCLYSLYLSSLTMYIKRTQDILIQWLELMRLSTTQFQYYSRLFFLYSHSTEARGACQILTAWSSIQQKWI